LEGLEKEIIPLLISEHDRLCRHKALYSEIRNMRDAKEQFCGLADYRFEDHLNFLINLDQKEEQLWKKMHHGRRHSIKIALKNNLSVEEMYNKDLLPIFYEQLKATYKHARIPLADITLFESAFESLFPIDMIKFFLVKHESRYIGGLVILLFNHVVYSWYGGALMEYIGLQATSFVDWHSIIWGKTNGCSLFDFGGGGNPKINYGPRYYKESFGGELVNFGRYKNIYKPIRMKTTDIGFEIYRRLFLR
jgi:lipid II:glycine glycyltransferase (peptidoglycan interpeptide bridge formation enzyme)